MYQLTVIYEDNHLLVIDKPNGLATMGVDPSSESAVRLAASYLRKKYHKPGKVFVGVVSRLDAKASGVLIFARTSKSASRLSEQIRKRQTCKRYLAWVEGASQFGSSVSMVDVRSYLHKNERLQRMESVSSDSLGSQLAELRLRALMNWQQQSILEVELLTGRKHQIRVQLADRGCPIIGDTKYGARTSWKDAIGLHCFSQTIVHPTLKRQMTFCSLPSNWQARLGAVRYKQLAQLLSTLQDDGTAE